jgi:two-component system sensor histidine kinase YesM
MKLPLREKLGHIKFSWLLSILICVFAMVPLSALLWFTLHSQQEKTIDSRMQELALARSAQAAQEEKMAELSNMVSQVFLNTSSLTDHLARLKSGERIPTQELLAFYRQDVASLEKVVVGNLYLYQVRVYADEDDIYEMVPILYGRRRMEKLAWAQGGWTPGTWQLDFEDTLFSSQTRTEHVMSLVSDITDPAAGHVGTLEVAIRMEDMFPALFAQEENRQTFLLAQDGTVYGADAAGADPAALRALAGTDGIRGGVVRTAFGGDEVLAYGIDCSEIGCVYLQVSSLRPMQEAMAQDWARFSLGALGVLGALVLVASLLVSRLLRGFYQTLDAVNDFSRGNLDVRVPENQGQDEVRQFAVGINRMLDAICALMNDNLERQKSAQTAQVRALQNQINAHFIYNVLEAIKMMAEIEEKFEIADAVTHLGKLLRYGMKWDVHTVTVAQEIDYIRDYIALMNLRFDYTVRLIVDVPPALLEQTLPKMSLQPIVENAVVHGAAVLTQDTEILICASHDERDCIIEVVDHGKGMTPAEIARLEDEIAGRIVVSGKSGNGIGLRNVQERIEMACGAEYGLRVDSELSRYTRVMVTVPYTARGGDTHENSADRRG